MDASISNQMTEAQFEAARAELKQRYGDSKRTAGIRFEQELARLYYKTGWTLEHIAQKEDRHLSTIGALCLFGRFLDFSATAETAGIDLDSLSETRFRKIWRQTMRGSNERIRFTDTIELLRAENVMLADTATPLTTKRANDAAIRGVLDDYSDGRWHQARVAANSYTEDDEQVLSAALDRIDKAKSYMAKVERKEVGTSFKFRIFRSFEAVGFAEIETKLAPLIEQLHVEGKKGVARFSPVVISGIAHQLQQLLDSWRK